MWGESFDRLDEYLKSGAKEKNVMSERFEISRVFGASRARGHNIRGEAL